MTDRTCVKTARTGVMTTRTGVMTARTGMMIAWISRRLTPKHTETHRRNTDYLLRISMATWLTTKARGFLGNIKGHVTIS